MKKLLLTLKQKWTEYLLEIFVIVIGILVAFSLNNWNESRIKDKSVRKHLESLTQAIEDEKKFS